MKQLTISIAAYNSQDYLNKCLDKFIESGVLTDLDIIVVNDGSKDRTKDIAAKYVEKYPDSIRLIDKANGGHGSTINASIPEAKGRYYKIVDSDDWLDPQNLKRYINDLRNSDEDLIVNDYWFDYTSGKKELVSYHQGQSDETFVNLDIHSLTIKTSIIQKVGPIIDEHCFYVDTELAIFPMKYVKTIKRLGYPLYDYLLGREGQSVDSKNMLKRRDQLLHITKRVITDYEENKRRYIDMDAIKYTFDRIVGCIQIYYWTMMLGKGKEYQNEIIDFDNWLKREAPELYDSTVVMHSSKHTKYLKFCRKTGFKVYGMTQRLLFKERNL